jgi:hypothetical protein
LHYITGGIEMAVTWGRKDETLTIRIDARSRYGLDLLGRLRRRSVSELVLDEIREVIGRELPKCEVDGKRVGLIEAVWDVFEQDRMVKLALAAPDLLNDDERRLWRVISEDHVYLPKRGKPNLAAIRRNWRLIQQKVREYEESAKGKANGT